MIANLRYEWRRVSSVRATWILTVCAVAVSALLAEVLALTISTLTSEGGAGAPGSGPELEGMSGSASDAAALQQDLFPLDLFVVGSAGSFITLILLGVVSAQGFGQDYRHGTIRLTLTLFPRRIPVFFSKAITTGAVIVVAYVASIVAAVLVALPNQSVVEVGGGLGFFWTMGRAVLFMLGFSLICFSITVLTRILALGVIIPVVLAVIAEPLLAALENWVSWIPKVLPFTSGNQFVGGEDIARNGLVYLAWIVVLMAAGLFTFVKRDA